ncbi:MAG: PHP domain-containing protein [Clostridia bacterium]|nr:PHP domain-containing protein [Oscillospiraceae bacterium]MBR6748568.1 PHP domain-containing protein [Clostridia bacterium]
MTYANLHLHSTHSDAGFRPAHLVCLAKSLGYGAIAVTDHEAISGIPELFAAAEHNGIEAMSGVELYARHEPSGHIYHVTGLDFDHTARCIVDFTDMMTEHRNEHTRKQFELACERGLFRGITWDDVVRCNPGSRWFCNDQVYFALDAMGIIPIARRHETFREAFKTGEAAKIKIYVPTIKDVIEAIRSAGGVAVLAHPPAVAHDDLPALIEMGLNGIETCHPDLSEDETRMACEAAVKYNLYTSGGTDHTGPMSACGIPHAVPADHGVSRAEYVAIKMRRYG